MLKSYEQQRIELENGGVDIRTVLVELLIKLRGQPHLVAQASVELKRGPQHCLNLSRQGLLPHAAPPSVATEIRTLVALQTPRPSPHLLGRGVVLRHD